MSLDIQDDVVKIIKHGQINPFYKDYNPLNQKGDVAQDKVRFNEDLQQAIVLLQDQYQSDIKFLERRNPYDKDFLKKGKNI